MLPSRLVTRLRSIIPIAAKQYGIAATQCAIHLIPVQQSPIIQLQSVRQYAKGKDKQKEKAKNKGVQLRSYNVSDETLNEIIDLPAYQTKLRKALEVLQDEFVKNVSLRSATGSIETLKVDVEGDTHELQDVAQIIRKNPKTIIINMGAFPQAIPSAIKALQKSGMNLNPQQDGSMIHIPVPKVTKDHRTALAKNAKALYNRCKERIRDAQTEYSKKGRRNSTLSEDDNRNAERKIMSMGKECVEEAEKMLKIKEKELLGDN